MHLEILRPQAAARLWRSAAAGLLAACALTATAEGRLVQGKVRAPDGEPAAGCEVELLAAGGRLVSRARTGAAGEFRFDSAPAGASRLRLTCPQAPPAGRALAAGGDTAELTIDLEPPRVHDRLAVTATRRQEPLLETPASGAVVTQTGIEERAAAAVPAALEGLAGVHVQRTALGGGSPALRGLIGNRVLVLVDGIRLNNTTFRLGPNQYLNTIDLNAVESVEVVLGPASSLYGSDALGGVVHLVTRRAMGAGGLGGELLAGFDSATDAPQLGLRAEGGRGAVRWVGGVSALDIGDLEAGGDVGVQRPTGFQRIAADLELDLELTERSFLTTSLQFHQDSDVPRYDRIAAGRDRVHLFDPQRRSLGSVRFEGGLGDSSATLTATAWHSEQTEGRTLEPAGQTLRRLERDRTRTLGAALQLNLPSGRLGEWTTGFEAYRDEVASARRELDLATGAVRERRGRFPDGARFSSAAGYGQVRLLPAADWSLWFGARYSLFRSRAFLAEPGEAYAADFDQWTGSARVVRGFGRHLRLSAGVSQGFRAPGLDDATIFGEFNAGIEVPNPDLDPERALSYELSLKALYRRLWVSATLFETRLEDLIDRAPGTFRGSPIFLGEAVFQRRNIDRGTISGAELDLRARPRERLEIELALATTHGSDDRTGEPLRRISPAQGRATVAHRLAARAIRLSGFVDFAARQDRLASGDVSDSRIPDGGTPGYAVAGVAASFGAPGGWRLNLVLENLGDKAYRVHGSGIDGPGRSVRAQLRLPIGGRGAARPDRLADSRRR